MKCKDSGKKTDQKVKNHEGTNLHADKRWLNLELDYFNYYLKKVFMSYFSLSISLILTIFISILFIQVFLERRKNAWQVIPREKVIGSIIGLPLLIWTGQQVVPMLEGPLEKFRVVLLPLTIFLGVLSVFFLSYIFTRAFFGLLIFLCISILHAAFTEHISLRPLVAFLCYFISTLSMYFMAYPWRFRNALKKLSDSPKLRLEVNVSLLAMILILFTSLMV